jgi:flagellar protein FlgJ
MIVKPSSLPLALSGNSSPGSLSRQAPAISAASPGASIAAGNAPNRAEKLDKAAEDFEALLLQQMMQSMWSSVPSGGMFAGGKEEEFYRDMLNQQLASEIAHSQSLGIKQMLSDDMKRQEGRGDSQGETEKKLPTAEKP